MFSAFRASSSAAARSLSTTADRSGKHLNVEYRDNVAVIRFDSPGEKMNSLNMEVMSEMQEIFDQVQSRSDVQAGVLISSKPGCFIAGADIRMLEACKTAEEATAVSKAGQDFMNMVENSKKPVVAAIMGPCLGGGLEVAMGCHYRIAVEGHKTAVGLPEVMLGLLPGSGGTVRLPKLAGLPTTLDMALTGKMVQAAKAKKLGIVDMVVKPLGPGLAPAEESTMKYLEEIAVGVAKDLASGSMKLPKRGEPKNFQEKAMKFALQYDFVKVGEHDLQICNICLR